MARTSKKKEESIENTEESTKTQKSKKIKN